MYRKMIYLISFVLVLGLVLTNAAIAVDPNLVGWWKFDGDACDSSGNNRHGTPTGDPNYGTGVFGQAINLDGTEDFVSVGSVGISGAAPRTIAGWAKMTNTTHGYDAWTDVFGFITSTPAAPSTAFNIVVAGGNSGNPALQGHYVLHIYWMQWDILPPDLFWHHFAATYDGTTVRWYCDGEPNGVAPRVLNTNDYVQMGGILGFTYFPGLIDDVRIYNRVLSAGEIKQLVNPEKASIPIPANGSAYDGTDVTLMWTQGCYADKHDVYFGTDFNDVNNATDPNVLPGRGRQAASNYPVTGLTPGAKYYWRIDEVSSGGSPIYKGDVWSFTVNPLTAYNPSPPDKDVIVDPNTNLSWSAGMSAADVNGHRVYFDPCEANVQARYGCEVNDVNRTDPNYIFGPLLTLGDTYYWAIDEVNGITTWPGPVWSFTTEPNIPITDPNLVGWWKFEDSNGGKTLDSSGHNRHGTLHGDPNYATGMFDQAINLDGTDDWVSVGSVGISGAAPRTIAGWAKMNATTIPAWTNVFGFTGSEGGDSNNFYTHFNIVVSGDNAPPILGGWYIIHTYYWQQPIIGPDLEWHHFAATYNGINGTPEPNTISWYCDGAFVSSAPYTINTNDDVQMGKSEFNENHFPGLIDDVRIYNKVLTVEDIRRIMASTSAYKPYPRDKATGVPWQLTLSWLPGLDAKSVNGHELYFSSDYNDVNDRSATKHVLSDPCYPIPSLLDLDQTYYWAVDEVNDPCLWEGKVWSFTTRNYAVVEDFNSYADSDALKVVWTEGSPIAELSLNTDSNYVRDGNSMQYHYDLYGNSYSEADANTTGSNSLPSKIGSNWKAGGLKALSLWFYGQAGNDANKPMYVKLTDGGTPAKTAKVIYDGDMNDIKKEEWQEWNIALQDFVDDNDVNLANVKKIAIGFGDGVAELVNDMGTVYFDDIRLYIPRCMPGAVPDSASGNCLVDYPDLQILINNWLISEYDVVPVEPNNNNLIGWWKLDDGNGTIAVDSSINDNNGTVYGEPKWVAGHIGSALDFNGVADYVDCSNDVSLNEPNITGKITLAAWVKTNDCGDSNFNPYITKGDHSYALQHRSVNELEIAIYGSGTTWHFASTPVDSSFNGVWHHLAGTYNGSQLKLYVDGELKDTNDYVGSIPSETNSVDLGTSSDFTTRWYNGLLDDVRIYSRALSQEEVAYLAERSTFTQPLEPLLTPPDPNIDLYDDGIINFKDYAVLADEWLKEVLWP